MTSLWEGCSRPDELGRRGERNLAGRVPGHLAVRLADIRFQHTPPPLARLPSLSATISARIGAPASPCLFDAWRMAYVPTLYKNRGVPLKSPVCAICIDRTRGQTTRLDLGYGVRVSLCRLHASVEFQCSYAGREFVLTLMRVWEAQGCMTLPRHRALEAHSARIRENGRASTRWRPGSYSWVRLREEAERRFFDGAALDATIVTLRGRHADDFARPPSVRTMRRWHAQRRWLSLAADDGARS